MKKLLKSKWNFIITISLVTAILLVTTMCIAFKNSQYNTVKESINEITRVKQIAARDGYIRLTRKNNAASAVDPVVEVAAAAPVQEEAPVVEEYVPEQEIVYYEEPVYTEYEEAVSYTPDLTSASADYYTAEELKFHGVIYSGGWRWTWYSQNVLPGGGLSIPGRHVDENGYVCDENDRICLASEDLAYGTVVATPFGKEGCVYDCGCDYGTLDVYVAF